MRREAPSPPQPAAPLPASRVGRLFQMNLTDIISQASLFVNTYGRRYRRSKRLKRIPPPIPEKKSISPPHICRNSRSRLFLTEPDRSITPLSCRIRPTSASISIPAGDSASSVCVAASRFKIKYAHSKRLLRGRGRTTMCFLIPFIRYASFVLSVMLSVLPSLPWLNHLRLKKLLLFFVCQYL